MKYSYQLYPSAPKGRAQWYFLPVCLSFLIALLLLTGCGNQQQQGNIASTSATVQGANGSPTGKLKGAFEVLHMINANVGWAELMNLYAPSISFTVVRTTDSGSHWQAVLQCSPYQGGGKGGGFATCPGDFRSATIATVVETQQSTLNIYHTVDGGQTWQRSTINAGYLETPPTFVDALHGWVLVTDNYPGYDPGSSYIGKEIALLRTIDGGHSWQKIGSSVATSQLPVTSDDAYGTAPFTASTRMEFTSPTDGWLVGTSSRKDNSSFSWLYITHDGGTNWSKVALLFPAQSDALWTPQFFTAQNGLLIVSTSGSAPTYTPETILYTTNDGGATWAGTFIPFDVTYASYIDMTHAWLDTGSLKQHTFATTSDGWRHWTKENLSTHFANINDFDFVSPTLGWAIADNVQAHLPEPGGGLRSGDIIALLKTIDSGHTWQEVAQSVV
ncbi:MAG: hypothetical protein ABI406_16260 [Ktedonobacteraceae bacterium]